MILSPVRAPARVTQHFGQNPQIYKRFGLKGHNGVDFTGPVAGRRVPIFSPYDGIVHEVGNEGDDGYGKYIRIRTAPDASGRVRECVLAHFHSISVMQGQPIILGDQVGIMGTTGFSSGVHLHLGLRYLDKNGKIENYDNGYFGYVDFEPYLLFPLTDPSSVVSYPYG